jgi:hypothetical protein
MWFMRLCPEICLQVPVGPVRLSADDMLHRTVRCALSLSSLSLSNILSARNNLLVYSDRADHDSINVIWRNPAINSGHCPGSKFA